MEKDYEKIAKLITLRWEYATRLVPVEAAIEQERRGLDEAEQEEMTGEWLSRRLDAGLFSLQVDSEYPCRQTDTDENSDD
jgi:beta-catenin-like protein 1